MLSSKCKKKDVLIQYLNNKKNRGKSRRVSKEIFLKKYGGDTGFLKVLIDNKTSNGER